MRKKIESDPRSQAHLNGAGKIADGAGTAKYAGMKVDLCFEQLFQVQSDLQVNDVQGH
jgi:hypothetical protein